MTIPVGQAARFSIGQGKTAIENDQIWIIKMLSQLFGGNYSRKSHQ